MNFLNQLCKALVQIGSNEFWVLSEETTLPDIDKGRGYSAMPKPIPFRYFKTSPEIIQLAVMLYVRFPLSVPPRTAAFNML